MDLFILNTHCIEFQKRDNGRRKMSIFLKIIRSAIRTNKSASQVLENQDSLKAVRYSSRMGIRSSRPLNLMFIMLLIFLATVLLYGKQFPQKSDKFTIPRHVVGFFNIWNECMSKYAINESDHRLFWGKFQLWTDACDKMADLEQLNLVALQNTDEIKYGLLPVKNEVRRSANNFVTLGIGKDIDAEVLFNQKINEIGGNMTFYGADPITDVNAELYSKIGKYFPFAVGSDAGYSSASVYVNGTYTNRDVVYVDIIYFFENILKIKTYDNIWLDAEGAEYPLFDIFLKGGRFDKNGIKFCQMSLEIHQPSEPQQIQFMELIKQIIEERRYGVHKNKNVGHMRMYLFNYDDIYCVKKFLSRHLYDFVEGEQEENLKD